MSNKIYMVLVGGDMVQIPNTGQTLAEAVAQYNEQTGGNFTNPRVTQAPSMSLEDSFDSTKTYHVNGKAGLKGG